MVIIPPSYYNYKFVFWAIKKTGFKMILKPV